jgi:N-terminal domain of reverse transcriptase
VRRLQTRIAKATREQDWRWVKAPQRFLVNSFSAKVLAVKRVSENDGKRVQLHVIADTPWSPGAVGHVRQGAKRNFLMQNRTRNQENLVAPS